MQHDRDNRSNQLNSNNPAYWQSRGYNSTPQGGAFEDEDEDDLKPPT
jgi:hypothetical protein